MSVIRTIKHERFTTISNEIIEDKRLRCQDLGMLVYLLSKPNDWRVIPAALMKDRGLGRDAVYEILKRLRAAGYAQMLKKADGSVEWVVSDEPVTENPDLGLIRKIPIRENPHAYQILIDKQNTDLDLGTTKKRFDPKSLELPEWMPMAVWFEWCEHRAKIRKPLTENGATKSLRFLAERYELGEQPGAIVDQAIMSGWQGLYPLKRGSSNDKPRLNHHAEVIRQHVENFEFLDDDFIRSLDTSSQRGVRGFSG